MPRKSRFAEQPKYASWADEINDYARQKAQSAPQLEPVKRYSRKAAAGRHQDARDYDVVTCVATSPQMAEVLKARDAEQQSAQISRAISKELSSTGRGYDVVTMQPKFGLSDADVAAMAAATGESAAPRKNKKFHPAQYDFNILTNQSLPTSDSKDNDASSAANASSPKRKAGEEENVKKRRPLPQRQTNIINHQYIHDHDQRVAEDDKKLADRIFLVASRANRFNPISGKFTNVDEEAAAQQEQQRQEAVRREKVESHTYRVSGIVARSEGHAFDIVTNQVYNPHYVLKLEQNNAKGVVQRASQRQTWEYQRDVEEAIRDNDVQRALNRVSDERLKEQQRRGHHVLTNQPFGLSRQEEASGASVDPTLGKSQARPALPMATLRTESVMERLHRATEPRALTTSAVLRDSGPRTTYERVFNAPPTPIAATISTFKGRQELLLPTIDKCKSGPKLRQQFASTTL